MNWKALKGLLGLFVFIIYVAYTIYQLINWDGGLPIKKFTMS